MRAFPLVVRAFRDTMPSCRGWPRRLAVRTRPFQGRGTGSIPVGVTWGVLAPFALLALSLQALEMPGHAAMSISPVSIPNSAFPACSCAKSCTCFSCCPAACLKTSLRLFPLPVDNVPLQHAHQVRLRLCSFRTAIAVTVLTHRHTIAYHSLRIA